MRTALEAVVAVPSRVFVGITVFGLIASLVVAPYTVLILSGYSPPPNAPYEVLFPSGAGHDAGDKAFLALASLFSVLLAVFGWRSLLQAARRDAALRKTLAERGAGNGPSKREEEGRGPPPPPPGYH